MTIHTIELKNSDIATYEDVTYTAKGNRHSPVPPLLRCLIADGRILPDDIIHPSRPGAMLQTLSCTPMGHARHRGRSA